MNAEEIISLFFYRRNPFALKIPDKHWIPIYRDVNISDVEKHINGYHTIGVYQSRPDETCRWACIDLDTHEYEQVAQTIHEAEYPSVDFSILEKSAHKGYHVWFFFSKVQRTPDAFSFLENILAAHHLTKGLKTKIDIFPRSPHLSGKRVGWLVRLPRGLELYP